MWTGGVVAGAALREEWVEIGTGGEICRIPRGDDVVIVFLLVFVPFTEPGGCSYLIFPAVRRSVKLFFIRVSRDLFSSSSSQSIRDTSCVSSGVHGAGRHFWYVELLGVTVASGGPKGPLELTGLGIGVLIFR